MTRFRKMSLLSVLALIFLGTRLAGLGISLAAYNSFQLERTYRAWGDHIEALWSNFDVEWYRRTATEGYEREPFSAKAKKNWAFLPLYPLLVRAVLFLLGPAWFFWAGAVLSNLFAFFALLLFARVLQERWADLEGDSARFFWLYLASAGSFYLSIPYNESLALFLMACCWCLTARKEYLLAAAVAGLGAITRVQLLGLLAIPVIPLIQEKKWGRALVAIALFSLPLLMHMGYLFHISGRSTAFFDMQAAWGNTHPYPLESFVAFWRKGWDNGPCQWIHFLFWLVFLGGWWRNWKKIPLNESLFCLAVLLISTSCEQFWGAYRYVLLLTPLYAVFVNEKEWFREGFLYFNAALGALYIIAFVNNNGFII